MTKSKFAWNKGLHTQVTQQLINTNIIWYDKDQKTWNRTCPICNVIIASNTNRAFEICLRSYKENRACSSCGRRKTKQNLIGKIFGKLTVIDEAPYRKTDPGPYWKCKCECGNYTDVRTRSLISGFTKSCGSISHRWTGYKEISGAYYAHIISGAKIRNLSFNLPIQYLWELFIKQNRKCALSGMDLSFNASTAEILNGTTRRKTASLDRIDSSKGYIEGNVQWVHKKINIMKNKHTSQDFIDMCKRVVEFNSTNKL